MFKMESLKLNLGCGNIRQEGFINIDIVKTPATDIVADVTKGLPFKDSSVDEVYGRMFLEHVTDFDGVMNEIYRVAKHNAKLTFIVPFCFSYIAYHPDHRNFFTFESFDIYTTNNGRWTKMKGERDVKLKKDKVTFFFQPFGKFNPLNMLNMIFTKFANNYPQAYTRLFGHLYPAYSIQFELRVIKQGK